ncbi:MAG: hypothetical protein QXV06_07040 [Ignisphaera sp.]
MSTRLLLSTCPLIAESSGATSAGTTEPTSRRIHPFTSDGYPAVIEGDTSSKTPIVAKTA